MEKSADSGFPVRSLSGATVSRWRAIVLDPAQWDWRRLLFFIGVPAIIGFYSALNNWAMLEYAGYAGSLLFYAGHAFVPWWTTCLATSAVMRVLRPWRPPQLLILTLGTILACLLVTPYSQWLTAIFVAGWLPDDPDGIRSSLHIHDQIGVWTFLVRASVVWISINLLFDRLLGLPRYRYDSPGRPRTSAARSPEPAPGPGGAVAPRFLERLPVNVSPQDVIALKAEQHYIKVYTQDRSYLTLYRFSDAVAEMGADAGQQVHRSYWVRSDAIRAVKRQSRKLLAELSNGLLVPISAPNRGLIQVLARSRRIPIYPGS